MKRKFLRFYIEKKFYSNFPRREMDLNSKKKVFFKVESFVKSDENIFFPKPSLPGHFLMGILILYLYNLLLFLLSYFRFKNILKK